MADLRGEIVLADIEGTTTSISFVKDELFPYAKSHSFDFLESKLNDTDVQGIVSDLLKLKQYEAYKKSTSIRDAGIEEMSAKNVSMFVNYLIDKDLKLGPLKTLQGLIWEQGYTNGSIKAHVFGDVPAAFKRWQEAGIRIAIYSSGSVKAQKLLFGQSLMGNLLPHICAHFDTAVGHKQEPQSYERIAKELSVNASNVIFLTDIVQEAEAARLAGMQTVIINRPGNAPLTDDQKAAFTVVNNFDALKIRIKK